MYFCYLIKLSATIDELYVLKFDFFSRFDENLCFPVWDANLDQCLKIELCIPSKFGLGKVLGTETTKQVFY